jgi:hypothetical protein
MVKTENARDRIPQWYYESQVRFAKTLHGRGPVSQAFKKVCEKGCNAKELQHYLFKLSQYPLAKAERQYKAKDLNRLERIAANVAEAAHELKVFEDLLFRETALTGKEEGYEQWEWSVSIPGTLLHLSARLHECVRSVRDAYRRGQVTGPLFGMPSAYERIPVIAKYVREATGRPHYAELTTLIGFAIRKPELNVEQLKMIRHRRTSTAVKK